MPRACSRFGLESRIVSTAHQRLRCYILTLSTRLELVGLEFRGIYGWIVIKHSSRHIGAGTGSICCYLVIVHEQMGLDRQLSFVYFRCECPLVDTQKPERLQ